MSKNQQFSLMEHDLNETQILTHISSGICKIRKLWIEQSGPTG